MKSRRTQEEKGPVELVDEAFHLLRRAPGSSLALYYLGTLPFLLALLFFWSDMARNPFAAERLASGTLGLSALFLWMKCWHGVFAEQLLAELCGEPAPRLTLSHVLHTALYQAIVQPLGLFVLPVSLALLVPTGWTYAFFANATVFSGAARNLRTVLGKSWQQARLWPMQSHYVVFLFKLFGLFVFLNVLSAVMGIPFLMKVLLGIETVFTQSPWAALNTTLLTGVASLTFLCIDPVLKTTYVLRCFYGGSLHTGQDLKAELKLVASSNKAAAMALLFVLLGLNATPTFAAEELEQTQSPTPETRNSLSPRALDRSIEEVIQQREYSWRLPRDSASVKPNTPKDENFIQRFFKWIESGFKEVQRWLRDFAEWLNRLGGRRPGTSLDGLSIAGAVRGLIYLLLISLAGLLVWLLIKLWKRRAATPEVTAEALPAMPDVSDENVTAEQLPEDSWSQLARELFDRGELRLALRAFYLASLAHLATRNLITLARFKSNRDYERELARRGHALAEMPMIFAENVTDFERVWYGMHEVSPELLRQFAGNLERMKSDA
jgi:hypothetical protein